MLHKYRRAQSLPAMGIGANERWGGLSRQPVMGRQTYFAETLGTLLVSVQLPTGNSTAETRQHVHKPLYTDRRSTIEKLLPPHRDRGVAALRSLRPGRVSASPIPSPPC
jgi:hypothetical protein